MALIDRLIHAIYKYRAEELILATGEKVTLTIGSKSRPVSADAATRQQMEVLLREILPEDLAPALDREGSHEFPYTSPSGSVQVQVRRDDGSLRIRAIPLITDEAAEPVGKAPASAAVEAADAVVDAADSSPRGEAATRTFTTPCLDPAPDHREPEEDGTSSTGDPAEAVDSFSRETAATPAAAEDGPSPEVSQAGAPSQASGAEEPAQEAPRPPAVEGQASSEGSGGPLEAAPWSRPSTPPPSSTQEVGASAESTQRMEDLFMKMVQEGCSDLHLSTGNPPLFRRDGEMISLGEKALLTENEVKELVFSITPRLKREEFERSHDTDFAHEVPAVARFRCNLFRDRMGIGGVFRQIPTRIPSAADLGLSRQILQLCELTKGLVLVTGPTGSGKSTTLAALIDHINSTRTAHIITIEDPIEFVHANQNCLVNQREVGTHTEGFKVALRAALREDPDCILVGEMRDLETIAIAIETAETGHLVFGTLHTNTASSTVDRMIDQFPADRQSQIRAMLSESLKGVLSQTLCKKKSGGRVAALEVLFVTPAVSNLIREGKAFQIPSIMQTGKGLGMATLNDALLDLVQKGQIAPREAYFKSVAKAEMKGLLERNSFKIDAA